MFNCVTGLLVIHGHKHCPTSYVSLFALTTRRLLNQNFISSHSIGHLAYFYVLSLFLATFPIAMAFLSIFFEPVNASL